MVVIIKMLNKLTQVTLLCCNSSFQYYIAMILVNNYVLKSSCINAEMLFLFIAIH